MLAILCLLWSCSARLVPDWSMASFCFLHLLCLLSGFICCWLMWSPAFLSWWWSCQDYLVAKSAYVVCLSSGVRCSVFCLSFRRFVAWLSSVSFLLPLCLLSGRVCCWLLFSCCPCLVLLLARSASAVGCASRCFFLLLVFAGFVVSCFLF